MVKIKVLAFVLYIALAPPLGKDLKGFQSIDKCMTYVKETAPNLSKVVLIIPKLTEDSACKTAR